MATWLTPSVRPSAMRSNRSGYGANEDEGDDRNQERENTGNPCATLYDPADAHHFILVGINDNGPLPGLEISKKGNLVSGPLQSR